MSDGGKGSKPRPFSVAQKEFDSNWDKIFGNKDENSNKTNQADQPSKSRDMDVQGLQTNTGR